MALFKVFESQLLTETFRGSAQARPKQALHDTSNYCILSSLVSMDTAESAGRCSSRSVECGDRQSSVGRGDRPRPLNQRASHCSVIHRVHGGRKTADAAVCRHREEGVAGTRGERSSNCVQFRRCPECCAGNNVFQV